MWLRGLRYLVAECSRTPYETQMDIWLRKELCRMADPLSLINDE